MQFVSTIKSEGNKLKGRERYIVTEISNDNNRCKIQKFTKDQLRNRKYEVKLNEIFSVVTENNNLDDKEIIRGENDEEETVEEVGWPRRTKV